MMRTIRIRDTSTPRQELPLLLEHLRTMVAAARTDATTWRQRLHERRDSALLIVGWVAALRRSEIIGLCVNDVTLGPSGWTVRIGRSKTDREGKGTFKALPTASNIDSCAPCAYLRWRECLKAFDNQGRPGLIRLLAKNNTLTTHMCGHAPAGRPPEGDLFRSILRGCDLGGTAPQGQLVHRVVRRRLHPVAASLHCDTTSFGAHSLRAGFVTEALRHGASPEKHHPPDRAKVLRLA